MLGLLKSERKIWVTNVPGVILGCYYAYEYRKYCPRNAANLPGTFSQHVNAIFFIAIFTLLAAFGLSREAAASLVGMEGVVFCVLLFSSPLAAMRSVIQTKSAKSIPLPFTLVSILNCTLWSVVGVIEMNDIMVYAPNLLGLLASVAQLALITIYGTSKSSPAKYKEEGSVFLP
uniref:Sugar transporter SWEET1 n=1 Tax=Proboscia inermis TaxID=420281 RepID=A0A7S0CEY2_9STRA|mmetsp:Transcript_42529/g.43097  ORF Transcript_42529/g.43097 Transcript_42529/m.43097 type:complete len:174 (+) Transcript_42529:77-598(+)